MKRIQQIQIEHTAQEGQVQCWICCFETSNATLSLFNVAVLLHIAKSTQHQGNTQLLLQSGMDGCFCSENRSLNAAATNRNMK